MTGPWLQVRARARARGGTSRGSWCTPRARARARARGVAQHPDAAPPIGHCSRRVDGGEVHCYLLDGPPRAPPLPGAAPREVCYDVWPDGHVWWAPADGVPTRATLWAPALASLRDLGIVVHAGAGALPPPPPPLHLFHGTPLHAALLDARDVGFRPSMPGRGGRVPCASCKCVAARTHARVRAHTRTPRRGGRPAPDPACTCHLFGPGVYLTADRAKAVAFAGRGGYVAAVAVSRAGHPPELHRVGNFAAADYAGAWQRLAGGDAILHVSPGDACGGEVVLGNPARARVCSIAQV